ncbi:MAG TPA: hypothetical protein VHR86_06180, partial [Armatimonadota bacterium]|nr:hypothetical protein [Armatimonadota bacterium]
MRTHTAFLLLICLLLSPLFTRPAAAASADSNPVVLVDLTEADAPTRLALTCLEGIVNRQGDQPRLYCVLQASDQTLFDQIYAKRGFKAEKLSPATAQERFATSIKGQVLYDPAQPETINLATALAGLEDALPATAATQAAGRRTVEDLRDRFHNRQEACQWALDKLASRVNQQKIALLAPDQMGLRDYLVSEKILPVSLDPKQAEEAKLLLAILDRFPAGALLFWDGHADTPADTRAQIAKAPGSSLPALAQAHGKLLVPGAAIGNFSFHARVPAYAPLHQLKRLVQHSPVKYVSFVFTGNGNLDFPFTRMRSLWDDEARGYVPLGWEIHPALVEMAPAVLSSYYADAWWGGSDQFVMAPSGGGYLVPSDAKALTELLSLTGKAARDADLTAISVLEGNAEKPWNVFSRVPEVRGILAQANTAAPTRIMSRAFIGETVRVTDPEKAAQAITAAGAGQQFILAVVDAAKVTPSQVATIAARLGQDYRVVFPYELLDLLIERDVLDHFDPQIAPMARIQSVTFSPTKLGPMDPITVKATISGAAIEPRVVYTVNDSAEFTEPLVWDGSIYRAVLPPVLRSSELKFRVRVADILLRTRWSGYCTLPVSAPDGDQDGLSDTQEKIYGLDPARADSDGDGL